MGEGIEHSAHNSDQDLVMYEEVGQGTHRREWRAAEQRILAKSRARQGIDLMGRIHLEAQMLPWKITGELWVKI